MASKILSDVCGDEDCDRPRRKAGNGRSRWCSAHHAARYRNQPPRPEAVGNPQTYWTVHMALKRTRGPAKDYDCACRCGKRAREWAYLHSDPDERVSPAGRPYSTDLRNYVALCSTCHRRVDIAVRKAS